MGRTKRYIEELIAQGKWEGQDEMLDDEYQYYEYQQEQKKLKNRISRGFKKLCNYFTIQRKQSLPF